MQEQILKEQQRTNELLEKLINQNEYFDELLTVEQVHEQYNIGIVMVRKMFNDKELPTQKYTVPYKVKRRALLEYMDKRHDYLCKE